MTYDMEGARVWVHAPHIPSEEGEVLRYYAATENYLTYIDGTTDTMWLSEEYLEAA